MIPQCDINKIIELKTNDGELTNRDIAELTGYSHAAIGYILRKYNLNSPLRRKTAHGNARMMEMRQRDGGNRKCLSCGEEFYSRDRIRIRRCDNCKARDVFRYSCSCDEHTLHL